MVYKETEKHVPLKGTQLIMETIPEYTQALDLLHKDFKTTVLNMLKELKKNTDKKLESGKQYINKMRMSTKIKII